MISRSIVGQQNLKGVLGVAVPSILVCLLLLVCSGTCSAQVDRPHDAEIFRQNTVKVEATQNGFGFIVGEKDGQLYVATARHVLVGDNEQPDSPVVKRAKVTFFADQGRQYEAEVLETHVDDLAVLRLLTPTNLHWIRKCLDGSDGEARGTKVWFIGRNGSWYVPVQPGYVSSNQPSSRSLIDIDGLPVKRGTSGAPLATSHGIVGMIQNDSEDGARALTIGFIKNAFQNWNYPWSLQLADVGASINQGPDGLSANSSEPNTAHLNPVQHQSPTRGERLADVMAVGQLACALSLTGGDSDVVLELQRLTKRMGIASHGNQQGRDLLEFYLDQFPSETERESFELGRQIAALQFLVVLREGHLNDDLGKQAIAKYSEGVPQLAISLTELGLEELAPAIPAYGNGALGEVTLHDFEIFQARVMASLRRQL